MTLKAAIVLIIGLLAVLALANGNTGAVIVLLILLFLVLAFWGEE